MIPGAKLLSVALGVIAQQTMLYFPYLTRTVNAQGQYIATYAAGVRVRGSVQPVSRTLYEHMGLDFQRNYYKVFVPSNIFDVARNVSGDQFKFQKMVLQADSKTNWFGFDGWDEVLCVEVVPI